MPSQAWEKIVMNYLQEFAGKFQSNQEEEYWMTITKIKEIRI